MRKFIGVLLVLMLVVAPVSASMIDDVNLWIDDGIKSVVSNLRTLTFTSYASSVPVQIGYDKPSEFWILSATVGWSKDSAILVKLPYGSVDDIGGGEGAKARKETTLTINPKGSYETATLTKTKINFVTNTLGGVDVPIYKVEGASWITTTVYDVSLNGQTQTVKVGMNYPSDVNLGSGAFIKNLGILSNGANAPSGDFVLMQNYDSSKWEFYRYDEVYAMKLYWEAHRPINIWASDTWYDIWKFCKDRNQLPPMQVMTANSYTFNPTTTTSVGTIQMNYDRVAYSSSIVVYIPKVLADTIIIQIGGSKAVILSKTDFKVTEGNSASFGVIVRNDGGDDYITVKATSQYYTISPVTKFMKNGETQSFFMTAYALQIDGGDKSGLPVSVMADGTDPYSGDSTTTVYGTTYDIPVIGPSKWKLTVIPKNPEGQVISTADVYIDNEKVFTGQNYVMKPKGTYTITGGNVTRLYAPTPIIVNMVDSDITKELQYSTVPSKQDEIDYTWIFWLFVIGIFVAIIYVSGLWKYIPILMNPAILIPLLYLIGIGIVIFLLWGLINAIANFKLF